MNLKLVAVSMSLLGLAASPVFADTLHKNKHTKKHCSSCDYKNTGSMHAVSLGDLTSPASSSLATVILDDMQQNSNISKPQADWFNRVGISGGLNASTAFGSTEAKNASATHAYLGENAKKFSNRAYFNVDSTVNDWVKALVVLNSENVAENYSVENNSFVEQAFIHVGNPDVSPIFVDIGKQYLDYGRYTTHPLTVSLDQVMTESLVDAAKVGFVSDTGINGSAYVFQRADSKVNYGVSLGYTNLSDQLGYKFGVSYMRDINGVNRIAAITNGDLGLRVDGVAAYAGLNYDAFTVSANYTAALKTAHADRLSKQIPAPSTTAVGARPWAAGVKLGYDFSTLGKSSNVYLGYQSSVDTIYLNLPRSRYLVGYSIDVLKNTKIAAEWDHDNSWDRPIGGNLTGDTNVVALRAEVKFG